MATTSSTRCSRPKKNLVPVAFDPFMMMGIAFGRYVDPVRPPHKFSRDAFGTAAGANAGCRMSQASRRSHVPSMFPSADTGWRATYGKRLFGASYIDTTASAWAAAYTAAALTRAFTSHLQRAFKQTSSSGVQLNIIPAHLLKNLGGNLSQPFHLR